MLCNNFQSNENSFITIRCDPQKWRNKSSFLSVVIVTSSAFGVNVSIVVPLKNAVKRQNSILILSGKNPFLCIFTEVMVEIISSTSKSCGCVAVGGDFHCRRSVYSAIFWAKPCVCLIIMVSLAHLHNLCDEFS